LVFEWNQGLQRHKPAVVIFPSRRNRNFTGDVSVSGNKIAHSRLTQHALACRLKKSQSFVAKYEGGERRLDVMEFVTVARALGADPLKLMTILSGGKAKFPRAKRAPSAPDVN
jgi:hypothetical protein